MTQQFKFGVWILPVLIVSSLIAASVAQAAEVAAGSVYDETREAEVAQKARRRAYPGGLDESELKVQSQLIAPTRKMTPQTESAENSAED